MKRILDDSKRKCRMVQELYYSSRTTIGYSVDHQVFPRSLFSSFSFFTSYWWIWTWLIRKSTLWWRLSRKHIKWFRNWLGGDGAWSSVSFSDASTSMHPWACLKSAATSGCLASMLPWDAYPYFKGCPHLFFIGKLGIKLASPASPLHPFSIVAFQVDKFSEIMR